MSKKNHDENLTCVVDRFENGQAVLIFSLNSDKQEFILPKRYLPKKAKEGEILHLEMYLEKDAEERQRNLAKKILEEILK